MDVELRELGKSFGPAYPVLGSVYGWIPFIVVILLSFGFSVLYIRHFWKRHEPDRLSAIVSTLGLWTVLLTSLLLPVDVFLISFMKNSNGTFKDWATNETRTSIENSINYTYYTFYAMILLFAFFLLPLVYFAYEEKDDEFGSMAQRLCSGLRYTSVFFLCAVILILFGAFIPYKALPAYNSTANISEWEKFEAAIGNIYTNKGQDALIFVVNVLTVIGMAALAIYTGLGMSAFPIGNLRGWQSLKVDKENVSERREGLLARISAIRAKAEVRSLSARDLQTLNDLEEEYHMVQRMETEVDTASASRWRKLQPLKRILDIALGILGMALGLLLWVSLLVVNIDKVLHSWGYKAGYLIQSLKIFNPLSYVMIQSQQVFPVDYILYCIIVIFLVSCTIAGVRYMGIWCLCVKMFQIRPHRTQPQGLIILCVILMYTVLAINILMYETIPAYTTFGSQQYRVYNSTLNQTSVVPCDHQAPAGECLMTRASVMIIQYAVKASFFSLVYFWMSWAFLGLVVLGFFIVIISKKRSFMEEAVDPDDFDDSDTEGRLLIA